MLGANINIAQDITPPFSLQTYEVLDGTWAEYRDREITDFFLGLRLAQVPVYDIGCTGFFGLSDGQTIGSQTAVRAWVTNFGNQPVSDFLVNYRFGNGPISAQAYAAGPLNPGAQALVTFSNYFVPSADALDELCAWTVMANDASMDNDTNCVQLQTYVGLEERAVEKLTLFPNPTNGLLRIDDLITGRYDLRVFEASGREVLHEQRLAQGGPVMVDLQGLADGTYRIQLAQETRLWQGAVVLQR
jgi:hypothetical protein